MPEDDDDYLSDKFLVDTAGTSKPTTYSQIRKEAKKKAQIKNEQNRQKSRRQRELESREDGLSKSLFERAKEEEEAGRGGKNKALSIMMKMGFTPGQSLGNTDQQQPSAHQKSLVPAPGDDQPSPISPSIISGPRTSQLSLPSISGHKTEPLPLLEWAGRKGIGLGKRAPSPNAAERLAKMAKMSEDMGHRDFRDRARDEYNNRRAEGRLVPAQLTCATLDEQMGKPFNTLWLNPGNHNTFPPGLIDALTLYGSDVPSVSFHSGDSAQTRLKKQIQADALQPVEDTERSGDMKSSTVSGEDQYPPDFLEEATQFLRLQAQDRLQLVLSYLRDRHSYCFWCGVRYDNAQDMQSQCPGPDEDSHD